MSTPKETFIYKITQKINKIIKTHSISYKLLVEFTQKEQNQLFHKNIYKTICILNKFFEESTSFDLLLLS